MLDVYLSWNEKLTKIDEEIYLRLWIYDPHIINSQEVAAYKDCLHFYDQSFDIGNNEKQFPFHKYTNLREKLDFFYWYQHIDCDIYTESDRIDDIQRGWISENEFEVMKGKAYKVETMHLSNGGIDKKYSVQVGEV